MAMTGKDEKRESGQGPQEYTIKPCPGCPGCDHNNKVSIKIDASEFMPEMEEHFKKGMSLYSAGEWDLATVELKKSLEKDPENAETHLILGDIAERKLDYDDAIEEYEQVLKLNPSDKFTAFKLETAKRQKTFIR